MAKIYNRLILNRIRAAVDPKLRYNQNGFRVKRTTVGQILALRRIIEEVKNNNLPAVLTFIDFKKAFDSIHRGKMIKILKAYGIPPLLLRGHIYWHDSQSCHPRWRERGVWDTGRSPTRRHTGTFSVHHCTWLCHEKGTKGSWTSWIYHHAEEVKKNWTSHAFRPRLCWWHCFAVKPDQGGTKVTWQSRNRM